MAPTVATADQTTVRLPQARSLPALYPKHFQPHQQSANEKHRDSECTFRKITGIFHLVKDDRGLQFWGTFDYRIPIE